MIVLDGTIVNIALPIAANGAPACAELKGTS
jgi:hypothetical protein